MSIESLGQLGAVFLSPSLTFFNQHLVKQKEHTLFFLAREGYWLEKSYQHFAQAQQVTVNSQYLLVSRAFLFKIGLINPQSLALSLNFSFVGSLYELLRSRFMLSDVSINKVFSAKQQQQSLTLPQDIDAITGLFESKQSALEPIIGPSFNAYQHYLTQLGFFEQAESQLVDLGYSGTIQTLLTLLFKQSTHGHYLMASKPGKQNLNGCSVTMQGYLNEGKKIGDGYIPIDRSMFLEALLTAPTGQFQDIRFSPLANKDYDFYFGRKVASQHQFHAVQAVCEGALTQMFDYAEQNVQFSQQEVETLITSYVSKKGMLPQASWPLFTIDDDIVSEGTVNGLDFFGLKL